MAPQGPSKDYYEILGITKNASESEIKSKYKRMALKFHPDKNPGDEVAAERFKEICAAYAVLSDPNKRRQYDLTGEDDGTGKEFEALDLSMMGTGQRAAAALFSKLGVHIQTAISQGTLEEARRLCDDVNNIRQKTSKLVFGTGPQTCKVDKQTATFFHFEMTEQMRKCGVVVRCISPKDSKFKLIYFDTKGGAVRFQEESEKSRTDKVKGTVASMFFLPFASLNLGPPPPLMMDDEEMPPLFRKLDSLEPSRYAEVLNPGVHLFAVYGDNFFRKVQFTIEAKLLAADNSTVSRIQGLERDLVERKAELDNFQRDYLELLAAYKEAKKRYDEEDSIIDQLVTARANAYDHYMATAAVRP
eukprot:Rmarinus@m.23459